MYAPETMQFHVSQELRYIWKQYGLQRLKKANRDLVNAVDGEEGVGKSLWTIQQFALLEPEAFETPEKFVSRIAFTPDEFFKLVRETKNGVVIFDEAFRGFSSRSALSKINRKLIQALMEMRQNNNLVFIVLPSIFLLDQYPAMLRSHFLFNIYFEKNQRRRAWRCFNKVDKNYIYQYGAKKGWTYPRTTKVRGWFFNKFPGGEEYEKAYLRKKSKALRDMDKEDEKASPEKVASENETKLIYMKYKELKSFKKLAEWCVEAGIKVSRETLRMRLKKYVDEEPENTEKPTK